jgi:catechol 2,3-dioxygenase-like lactoylglutathione lyase family enzyme
MSILAQARIGQIAIVCKDVERATAFYRDALGLRFLFAAAPALSFFDSGGVRLMLSASEGQNVGTSVLYFFVPNIDDAVRELADKRVRFIDQPHMIARMPDHELWLAAFYDSEDNVLAVMEERRSHTG